MRIYLLITLLVFPGIFGQQGGDKAPRPGKKPPSIAAGSEKKPDAKAPVHDPAVERVKEMSEQALAFQDVRLRALVLGHLADPLWKHDEEYARGLFIKALDATAAKNASSPAEARSLNSIHRRIITLVARHDATLAKRYLADANSDSGAKSKEEVTRDNFRIAYDLIQTDPQRSAEFARMSLRSGVSPGMISLLKELRVKDEAAANALFQQTVQSLAAQPNVDIKNLLHLGTYVFTSPKVIAQGLTDIHAVAQIGVGNQLVYDITADRPGVPPPIIRSYLDAAVSVIIRPVEDPAEKQLFYIASYLLLPKTERFAPDLTPRIAAMMQRLSADVSPELVKGDAFKNLSTTSSGRSSSEILKDIEKVPDQNLRDSNYLRLAHTLWSRSDFTQAREVVAKIKDTAVQTQLNSLMDFGEAAKLIKEGTEVSLTSAEELTGKLPEAIDSAILWLGIAQAWVKLGKVPNAREALNSALRAANKVNDARRPHLLLAITSQLTKVDPEQVKFSMENAVTSFNSQKPEALNKISWQRNVEFGKTSLNFPLKVEGVQFGFAQALPALVAKDLDGTLEILKLLQTEELKAQVMLSLAEILLQKS